MSRPVRNQPKLDYKILHSTGRRVCKGDRGQQNNPNMDELHLKTIDICSDVDDFFSSYSLDELEGEEELQDYVAKIEVLKREFRRIHSQLKGIEEVDFPTKYPYYEARVDELTATFNTANKN